MSTSGSVTHWIVQLKAGDRAAAQPLWENYFRQLTARARHQLAAAPRRAADEEDVALSAFASFCCAAEQGRFPRLDDRHDLWQVLMVLTDRKAYDLVRDERRQRRGGGKVLDEAALADEQASAPTSPLAQIPDQGTSPAFAALLADECQRLLGRLTDSDLRRVAVLKMEGYTVEEIAGQLGRVPRTIKRWLQLIRRIWNEEPQP
jgi:DNA-directed RNA polymerase specialized sigma24 family protein